MDKTKPTPDPEIARLYDELVASCNGRPLVIVKQSAGHVRWLNECARLARVNGLRSARGAR